jgi:hypothetical protein
MIDRIKAAQDPIFTPHIMGAFDRSTKGRATQHQLSIAETEEIGEVGKAARELLNN